MGIFNKIFSKNTETSTITNEMLMEEISSIRKSFDLQIKEISEQTSDLLTCFKKELKEEEENITAKVDFLKEEAMNSISNKTEELASMKEELEKTLNNFIQSAKSQQNVNKDQSVVEEVKLIANSLVEMRDYIKNYSENNSRIIESLQESVSSHLVSEKVASDIIGTINNSNNKRSETLVNLINEAKNKHTEGIETIAASIGYLISKEQFVELQPTGPISPASRPPKRKIKNR